MPCLCSDTAVIPLHHRTIIGRAHSCDLVLEDLSIFDRHAAITIADDSVSAILTPLTNDQGELGVCYLNDLQMSLPGRVVHCDRIKFGHVKETFVYDIKRQASRGGSHHRNLVSVRERIRELLMGASSDDAISELAHNRLHQEDERATESNLRSGTARVGAAVMHPPLSLSSSGSSHGDRARYSPIIGQRELVQAEKARLVERLRDVNHILAGVQPFQGSSLDRERYPIALDKIRGEEPLINTKQSGSSLQRRLIHRKIQRKRHQVISTVFSGWRLGIEIQAHRRQIRQQQIATFDMWKHQNRFHQHFYRWKALASQKLQARCCRVEGFQARQQLHLRAKIFAIWRHETYSAILKRNLLRRIFSNLERRSMEREFSRWRRLSAYETLQAVRTQFWKQLERRRSHFIRSHRLRVVRSTFQFWNQAADERVRVRRLLLYVEARVKERKLYQAWIRWDAHTRILCTFIAIENDAARQLASQREAQVALYEANEQLQKKIRDLEWQVQEAKERSRLEELESRERMAERSVPPKFPQSLEAFLEARLVEFDHHIERMTISLDRIMLLAEKNSSQARRSAACLLVHILLEQKSRNCREQIQLHDSCLDSSTSREKDTLTHPRLQYTQEIISQRLFRLYQLYQSLAEVAALKSAGQVDPLKHRHAKYLAERIHQQMKAYIDKVKTLYAQ